MASKIGRWLLFIVLFSGACFANQAYVGYCSNGGTKVVTSGLNSTTSVMASYPGCTVTVNNLGGGLATIFSDNLGTPLSNPFQASLITGQFIFYANNARYSITLSGGTPLAFPLPVTITDVLLNDPASPLGCLSIPALTGDVTSAGGTCATVLPNIAAAGTGLKTTINAKGQVTGLTTAASTDLSDTAIIARLNAAANFGVNPVTTGALVSTTGTFSGSISGTGATFTSEVAPSVTGVQLGDTAHRWDLFARNIDWSGTFTGGTLNVAALTVTGPSTLSSVTCKNLEGIRCADQFTGADWAAKVNAADADLGATPGTIYVSNSLAGAASTALTISANHLLWFAQGTFSSSVAQTITASHIGIQGTEDSTIIQFTGATDGFVMGDQNPQLTEIHISGLNIQTTNAAGGKAISFNAPVNGSVRHTLRDIHITASGAGRWSYGIFGDGWEVSNVYNIFIDIAATVGVHLQDASNANQFYGLEVRGTNAAGTITSGIEFMDSTDGLFHGGTIQGYFANNLINFGSAGVGGKAGNIHVSGFHLENANLAPADGADVVNNISSNISVNSSFSGLQGGSFNIGTNAGAVRNLSIKDSEVGAVVIGANSIGAGLNNLRATSITDNSLSTSISACTDGSGNKLANKSGNSQFEAPNTTTIPLAVTGSTSAITLGKGGWLSGIDNANALHQLFLLNNATPTFRYVTAGTLVFQNDTPTTKMTLSDTALTLASGVVLNATSPTINGTPTGTGIQTATLKTGTGAGNYTSASITYVRVDSTNLAYTVTIPTGWKLMVNASGTVFTATAAVTWAVSLADGAADNTGILIESSSTSPNATTGLPWALNYVIAGDGASHTINLQYKTTNGADSVTMANSTSTFKPSMTFLLTPSN